MKKGIIVCIIVVVVCMIQFLSCNNKRSYTSRNIQEGYELSQKYCTSCHVYPDPTLLNKITWAQHVLPKMGALLGFRRFASDYIEESDTTQIITLEQWKNIVRYYVSQSPEDPLTRTEAAPKITMRLVQFGIEIPTAGSKNPATTMVLINPLKKEIIFGDGLTEHLYRLSVGNTVDSIKIGIGISNLQRNEFGFTALTMGVLYPSDIKNGKLIKIYDNKRKQDVLIDSLQRPVHAAYSDVNSDGLEDITICEFGNTTGYVSWFERKSESKFTKHILRAQPGSVKTEVHDFNKDGRPDIIALMAQGDEGFFIYYNEGYGRFRDERILRLSPSYGSNYFELVDFNNDGFMDILSSNGDNGDYPPILKAYHGIRIYLNDGKNQFREKIFCLLMV